MRTVSMTIKSQSRGSFKSICWVIARVFSVVFEFCVIVPDSRIKDINVHASAISGRVITRVEGSGLLVDTVEMPWYRITVSHRLFLNIGHLRKSTNLCACAVRECGCVEWGEWGCVEWGE